MPITIKELHIKIYVDDSQDERKNKETKKHSEEEKKAIVASCVDTVMELLEKQKER